SAAATTARCKHSTTDEYCTVVRCFVFFFQAEDGIRDRNVTGVQTCALPISLGALVGGVAEAADDAIGRAMALDLLHAVAIAGLRSEERRVGKECGWRWWAVA